MIYLLSPSKRQGKKWQVITPSGKVVYFGASGYQDYTTHKDITRYKRYIQRHQARENWEDPETPGFWARWILWNKPSFKDSIKDTEKRFNIEIHLA